MAATKEQYETLFSSILEKENEKKSINDEIKANIETFSSDNELNKKALKRAYASWKALQSDRAKFMLEEADYDAATNAILETENED